MEKPKKKRRWWILIVIIILLLLCVLGVFFILTRVQFGASGPAPTQALYTTEIKIVISSAAIKPQSGDSAFVVSADTDLTVQSNDTKDYDCSITGNSIPKISILLRGGQASEPFQLPAGVYKLTCDNDPKRVLNITAQ